MQCHKHYGKYQDGPDVRDSYAGCNFSKHCPDLHTRVATVVASLATSDVNVRSQHSANGRDFTLAIRACQWLSSDLLESTYPIET